MIEPLFNLGNLSATPGALEAIGEADQKPADFLSRHASGDWGDCSEDDAQRNNDALTDGSRIFSVYHTNLQVKLWVITEGDRSRTTILLPDEY